MTTGSPGQPRPEVLAAALESLRRGQHADPHAVLGSFPCEREGTSGVLIRAFHPDACAAECLLPDGGIVPLKALESPGAFEGVCFGAALPLDYRVRFSFRDGVRWERRDPYRFLPTISENDLRRFGEGRHHDLWRILGARCVDAQGVSGVAFSVWAPNAAGVSVVGDFCGWDGRLLPMRELWGRGVFELFVPDLGPGAVYKYEIRTRDGRTLLKSDPMAGAAERSPGTSAVVTRSAHEWADAEWIRRRAGRDLQREPMSIYEVHLGSWQREGHPEGLTLGYRELATRLVPHVAGLGFTHIELMPVAEHPLAASWGYQITGFYAPTSRLGSPDDLRFFVDSCHEHGISVILDWVAAHFPRDDWALARFDGTPLYENPDTRLGEQPEWGTLMFNLARHEVRDFLVSNALYWIEEFHVDGIRADAVTSMLYLDWCRPDGQWVRNRYGGRENLEAIDFFRELCNAVHAKHPGVVMVAEESTPWPGVTKPSSDGGLAFDFKWNMGWMHDTLEYLSREPIDRIHHHEELTFGMLYEHTENFILPLSHDEVVHGKGSLWRKIPGDPWQKLATLRLLLTYQFTRPGKKLLFMGTELAPYDEWYYARGLDWHLDQDPARAAFRRFLHDLVHLYRGDPCFFRKDADGDGFRWLSCDDRRQSVVAYQRTDGERNVLVALNFTPETHPEYRIGVPQAGWYIERFNSDDGRFGGSRYPTRPGLHADPIPMHGFSRSVALSLPPLAGLILAVGR